MALMQPCVEKIFINLNAPAAFNLRQKILGEQNANLQYIVNETKANASLRGRGSGFVDSSIGMESNEPLHLYIEHPSLKSLIEAKNLARNLLETIQQDLQAFVQSNPNSQAVPIQQPPPIIQASNQSITIPSAVLSVPPPNIIQNGGMQPTHIIQQPNFLPQSQIIPQPMQIIQNIPPPTGIPIRAAATTATAPISVQFQGQPTNIQLQPAAGQQILLNQTPTQQYQLQYIPASAGGAQTIQHFIQPQQQIQGILQPNGQQFITVQGNTAFMLPPPNLAASHQNIGVFNTAPPMGLNALEDAKEKAAKQEEQQKAGAAHSRININQPPPSIQQFIVNANAWPQTQHLQQMPINSAQQFQIVAHQPPPTIRNGNELVIPATIASGQQLIATFNPQQGPPLQQIQFSQPLISQPPPTAQQIQIQNVQNILEQQQQQAATSRANMQTLSYQQQFEQKINLMSEGQQRALKRKIDESEAEASKAFPKSGMGSMTKTRPPPPLQQQHHQPPMTMKMNSASGSNSRNAMAKASTSGVIASTSGDNMSINNSKNNSNKSVYNKNSTAPMTAKMNVSQVDAKSMKSSKGENEFSEAPPPSVLVHQGFVDMQNQFMQPPPNMQFSQSRAQMMIPPPTIQIQQQDINSFASGGSGNFVQQVNVNRFSAPTRAMTMPPTMNGGGNNDSGNVIAGSGNYQQPPRFQRQQWQ